MRLNRWVGLAFVAATAAASSAAIAGDWSGAYVGFGLTANRTDMRYPGSYGEVIVDNTSTPGLEFDQTLSLDRHGLAALGHVIGGYIVQDGAWLFGAEGDIDLGQVQEFAKAPGSPACASPAHPLGFSFTCLAVDSFGSLQTYAHVRALAGKEITPTMMGFLAGGIAFGTMQTGLNATALAFQGLTPALFNAVTVTSQPTSVTGYSLGLGVQLKASERLLLRAEYLYDAYATMNGTGAIPSLSGGVAGFTASVGITGGKKLDWTNQALRVSAIYRLGGAPNSGGSDPEPQADWSGLYLGGGLTVSGTAAEWPGTSATAFYDAPGTGDDSSTTSSPAWKDGAIGGHILAGARIQAQKFTVGAEGDVELGSGSSVDSPLNFPACSTPFAMSSSRYGCAGVAAFGGFKVDGHLRAVAGLELTPTTLGYVAAGAAFGHSMDSGFVGSSVLVTPSTLATGTDIFGRLGARSMVGYSLGGGVEVKATANNTVRVEYLYDRFANAITAAPISVSNGVINPPNNYTAGVTGNTGSELDFTSQTLRVSAIHQF